MIYLITREEYEGKENLEKAFNEITRKQPSSLSPLANLEYRGFLFPSNLLSGYKSEVNDLIRHIETEEKSCDEHLQRYCPAFYIAVKDSRTPDWTYEQNSEQEKTAKERI